MTEILLIGSLNHNGKRRVDMAATGFEYLG